MSLRAHRFELIGAVLAMSCLGASAGTWTRTVEPVIRFSGYNAEFASSDAAFADWKSIRDRTCSTCPWTSITLVNQHRWQPAVNGLVNGLPTVMVSDIITCNSAAAGGGCTTTLDAGPGATMLSPRCPQEQYVIGGLYYRWQLKYLYSGVDKKAWCQLDIPVADPAPKSCPAGNPVYPETGLKTQVEADYVSESNALRFIRRYRSDTGRFGSVVDALLVDNTVPSIPLQACVPGTYTETTPTTVIRQWCYPVITNPEPGAIQVTTADGTRLTFQGPVTGITSAVNVNDRLTQRLTSGAKEWVLRREKGSLEIYDQNGKLVRETSLDGRRDLTYTYAGGMLSTIADPFGRTLRLTYDSNGGLATLTDPDGALLAYGVQGIEARLGTVAYPGGHVRTYTYNEPSNVNAGAACPGSPAGFPGALTGIGYDGARFADFKYECSGRAASTEHVGGVFKYSFNYLGSTTEVTDPLGSKRTFRYANSLDVVRLMSTDQPAGSGCAASTSTLTYDANGNVESKDDFDGNRVCYLNDPSRNLEGARVEGLANSVSCAAVTAVGAALPAGSRKISTEWHPFWRLETRRAEPGRLTTWVYHGQPDPFNGGALAGCATAGTLLPDGSPIAVLCKQVEQATTDADGHVGFAATLMAGVPNRVRQWTYNAKGQVLTIKGPRTDVNDTTTFAYHATTSADYTAGDLSQVTNAALQTTQFPRYNKHGQVLRSIDPNGIVTDYTYDVRQRLMSVTVGGQQTLYTYDVSGLLKQLQLPDTTTITYAYDPARRLTKVTDQSGNSITFTLDNAGNRRQDDVKDASGTLTRSITRVFDALGRVQQMRGGSN